MYFIKLDLEKFMCSLLPQDRIKLIEALSRDVDKNQLIPIKAWLEYTNKTISKYLYKQVYGLMTGINPRKYGNFKFTYINELDQCDLDRIPGWGKTAINEFRIVRDYQQENFDEFIYGINQYREQP